MGIISTESGSHLLTEDGDPMVTEDYIAPIIGNVIHPDTLVEFYVETEYSHRTAPQPEVLTSLVVETEYESPPSSGGQPKVITTLKAQIDIGAMLSTVDAIGAAHIDHSVSGKLSVHVPPREPNTTFGKLSDHAPPQTVNTFTYESVNIVKVKMPKPTTFDQFGRPTG